MSDPALEDLMHRAYLRAFWEGGWLLPRPAAAARLLELAYAQIGTRRLNTRQRRKLAVLAAQYAAQIETRHPI